MKRMGLRITSAGVYADGTFIPLSQFDTSRACNFARTSEIRLTVLHIMKRWLQFVAFIIFLDIGYLSVAILFHAPEGRTPILFFVIALINGFLAWKGVLFATRLYVTEVITADGKVVFFYDRHNKEDISTLDSRLVKAFDQARHGIEPQFGFTP